MSTSTANPSPAWLAEFITLAAIWGVSFLFQRLAVGDFGVVALTFVRVASAAVFLVPILLSRGLWPAFMQHYRPILFLGVLQSAIPFLLFAYAVQHISTGLTGILNASTPLFGALVAWVWLSDKPTASRMVGLGVGFAGIVMLSTSKANFSWSGSALAIGGCLLASLLYGVGASYTKRYLTGVPPIAIATGSQLGAALVLLVPGLLMWPQVMPSVKAWSAALAVGVVCSAVAYVLFYRLIAKIGPARTIPLTFIIPVFAMIAGVLFLDEQVTTPMLVWGTVILLGTSLATGIWSLPRLTDTSRSQKL